MLRILAAGTVAGAAFGLLDTMWRGGSRERAHDGGDDNSGGDDNAGSDDGGSAPSTSGAAGYEGQADEGARWWARTRARWLLKAAGSGLALAAGVLGVRLYVTRHQRRRAARRG
jgi:hypothetical protein